MAIDYKPDQNEYKNMTPFKTWLMYQINTWGVNNFPFLENDFDQLTNYGMMMKLMKAVNDNIYNQNLVEDDMTKLYGAFTELQTYINNYFDNLDVQEEINNKLDEMVEDGTMDQIINQEIFGQINSDISNLKEYVDLKNMPTLFIGDSYTNASNSYADRYKTIVGLDDNKYFKYAIGGAGFHAKGTGNKDYNDLLADAIAGMTTAEKNSIKQIIVGTLINDANYESTRNQIITGLQTFMSTVSSNYPNAKVYIIGCGYRLGTSSSNANVRSLMNNVVIETVTNANITGKQPIFIDNSQFWLRHEDWFNDDGLHPNETGQAIIANRLIRGLQGQTDVNYRDYNLTLTLNDSNETHETVDFPCRVHNNLVNFQLNLYRRIYYPTSITARTFEEIGTFTCPIIHPMNLGAMDIPIVVRIYLSGGNDNFFNGILRFGNDGKVYLMVMCPANFTDIVNLTIYSFRVDKDFNLL